MPTLVAREVVDASTLGLCPLRFSPTTGLLPLHDDDGEAPAAARDAGNKPLFVSFHNCLRRGPPPPPPPSPSAEQQAEAPSSSPSPSSPSSDDDRAYFLGRQELRALGRQTWVQRVGALMARGEWLEGLALALDCYARETEQRRRALLLCGEGEKGRRSAAGVRRAMAAVGEGRYEPRASFSGEIEEEEEEGEGEVTPTTQQRLPSPASPAAGSLALFLPPPRPSTLARTMGRFLDAYLQLGLESAPSSASSSTATTSTSTLVRAHFQLLAGVCAEFCLATGRLDRLYGHVFSCFLQAGQVRWLGGETRGV